MQKYADVVMDLKGSVVPGALVRVKTPAGADAALYSANGADPISNPMVTDTFGRFAFYAANGRYNLQVFIGTALFTTLNDVLLEDPLDASPEVIDGGTFRNGALENVTIDGQVPATMTQLIETQAAVDTLAEAASDSADAASASATSAAASASAAAASDYSAFINSAAAESAAAMAAAASHPFPTTADGLANTSGTGATNRYFSVPPGSGKTLATLYRNDAGVAVNIGQAPSAEFVQAVSDTLSAVIQQPVAAGTLVSITDGVGKGTWLEANDVDGGPTSWAAQMLTKSLVPSLVPASVTDSIAADVLESAGISKPVAAGILAAITGASGLRTWLEARDTDGGPTDWALSMLSSRLASGSAPAIASNNAEALRAVRMFLRQIKAADAGAVLNIGFIGDSYTAGHLYWLNKLTLAMAQDYGFAGPGYIGFNHGAALGDTNFQYSRSSTTYFGGAWSVSNLGTASPDSRTITSTAVGDYVSVNAVESAGITTAITAGKLLYLGDGATHTLRYRWADADAWNTLSLTGTGPQQIVFPVLPAGTGWKFRMEVVTGTPTLFGIYLSNSLTGIRFSKMAASGSTSGNWFSTDPTWQTQWKAAAALIPMDVYFIMLGANDQGTSVTPDQYLANIQGLVGMIRSIAPGADIHLCMQAETPRVSTYPISVYGTLLRNWAYSQGIPCSDLQYTFGRDVPGYASTGTFPLIDTDNLHPIITKGGRLITEFFYRLLRFS